MGSFIGDILPLGHRYRDQSGADHCGDLDVALVEKAGGVPYGIPAGASEHPLGDLALPTGPARSPSRKGSSVSSSTRSSSAR
jgi:hypothetical protein